MFDPKALDELARRVAAALPTGVRDLQQDAEKNLRTALQTGFARLDLVTREEFDVQSAVLARTRQRLEALEQRVAELEAQVLEGHTHPAAGEEDFDGG